MGGKVGEELDRAGDTVKGVFGSTVVGNALGFGPEPPKVNIPNSPPPAPTLASKSVQDALSLAKLKRDAKSGRAGTIKTSPLGITERANVPTKELLGE